MIDYRMRIRWPFSYFVTPLSLLLTTAILLLGCLCLAHGWRETPALYQQPKEKVPVQGLGPSVLQDSQNMGWVGAWPFGPAKAVAVQGSYCYLGSGGGIYVIDVSAPNSPSKIAEIVTPGLVCGLAVAYGYLYVADGPSGLRVIDVSNPLLPEEVGFYDTPGWARAVAISGSYAYVADGPSGLCVIDISDSSSPQAVCSSDTPGYAQGVAVSGAFVYVADGSSGLRVMALCNEVGVCDITAQGVAVSGSYAYVADGSSRIWVVDVSNPTSPNQIGFCDAPNYARGVAVSGGYAYVADGGDGLRILDLLFNPPWPLEVGSCDTPGHAWAVAVLGGYAYVADGEGGLRIVNISNPSSPQEVGFYNTPDYSRGVAVSGNYAYIADYGEGLRVIDISNPSSPQEVGFYHTPDWPLGVAVSGGYVYVADGWSGLRVIDVSSPSAPDEAGFCDTPGYAQGVALSGGYAYVADGEGGLRIMNISNPSSPQEVGFYDTPDYACGVEISGNYAYVAAWGSGLRVIDVSNPSSPQEVGSWDTASLAYGVTVSGSYAYLADYSDGLRVIDVSNPSSPQEVGFYDTPGYAQGVAVAECYVYVADADSGLQLLRFTGPTDLQVTAACDSTALNIQITVDPADNNGDSDGTTPFTRTYQHCTEVTLTAPDFALSGFQAYPFSHWEVDGTTYQDRTIAIQMEGRKAATAYYTMVTINSVSPNPFSPNSDGIDDTTSVVYSISDATMLYVVVLNYAGTEIVKMLVAGQNYNAGTYLAVWDGTDTNGSVMPDATYWIAVMVQDAAGKWWFALEEVTVNSGMGIAVSASPNAISPNGDGLDDTTTITYSIDQAATVLYLLVLNEAGTEIINILVGPQSRVAGTYQEVWDGTNSEGAVVADGLHWIVLLARGDSGSWQLDLCVVTVENP